MLTIASCTMVCFGSSWSRSLPCAARSFCLLLSASPSWRPRPRLRQGQRHDRHGPRAAGLDPTTAPAAAIREVTHYNIFEGLTRSTRISWSRRSSPRSRTSQPTSDPTSPSSRTSSSRTAEPFVQGRQVLVRALRRQGLDQQGQGLLRLDQSIDTPDPTTVVLSSRRRVSRRCFTSA